MKFKIIAAILGLMIAIPGVVIAQGADDQVPDQDSKPSPSIRMQAPNDQGSVDQDSADQDSVNPGPLNQGQGGPMDAGPTEPGAASSTAPAPEGKSGVARIKCSHGGAATQRGDTKDWSAPALNAPVLARHR